MEREGRLYVHSIDASDHIVWVSPDWLAFAHENGARLTTLGAAGTSLWMHISGTEVRHLYGILLQQVRHTGRNVHFPFRCDTPTMQRDMQMVIVPKSDGYVEFQSHVLHCRPVPYVVLLDAPVLRSDRLLRMCSWCRRVALTQEEWVEPQVAVARLDLFGVAPIPQITHSVCPSCDHDIRTAVGLIDQ